MNQVYSGTVIKKKDPKTVTVELISHHLHPKYHKFIRSVKKMQVHNENFDLNLGDKVTIKNTRPRSKNKCFLVIEKKINKK